MIAADVHDLIFDGIILLLWLCAPVLAAVFASGVVMAILARFTRLAEPSLSFASRFIAVLAVLLISLPWIGRRLVSFTVDVWSLLASVSN